MGHERGGESSYERDKDNDRKLIQIHQGCFVGVGVIFSMVMLGRGDETAKKAAWITTGSGTRSSGLHRRCGSKLSKVQSLRKE